MWRDLRKSLRGMDRDRALELIGLERRRSVAQRVLPAIALLGVGVLVGVGVGVMVAPQAGRELRKDLRGRLQHRLPTADERVQAVAEKLQSPRVSAPHA